jgi:hypothetical protein
VDGDTRVIRRDLWPNIVGLFDRHLGRAE